ncbi:hypothetical protein TrST_g3418 [Triparma strigata]|uniref:UDP-galactose transporter n=1 Tax=Triparma strigata TaxID=1606541 RepID=A0A9W7BSI6_9STRA|nr:hypothetical protein TrST_g3418 [Triparma strigata]
MVGLVILMRYSRVNSPNSKPNSKQNSSNDDDLQSSLYISSTAVFTMELLKFFICTLVLFHSTNYSFPHLFQIFKNSLIDSPYEVLKLSVPSLLYALQNNLLYCALTNLDAASYQVIYQLKILTTALFSVTMLHKKLTVRKWFSLILLSFGVILAQTSTSQDSHVASIPTDLAKKNRLVGTLCVVMAACTSGFSGVYFEKILKGSPKVSLWIRNIQMGLPSVLLSLLSSLLKDYSPILRSGFFHGYTTTVWSVILVQAGGGLLVALVVKYADNVLKVFAASFSIVVNAVVSYVFFGFVPDGRFCVGTVAVCCSIVIYSGGGQKKRTILPLNRLEQGGKEEKENLIEDKDS